MYHPEKLAEDSYQEAQWQIDDYIIRQLDDLYTTLYRILEDTHLIFPFTILTLMQSILMKVTHREQTLLIVPRSFFHECRYGQNQETCPAFDSPVVHPSNIESHCQSQEIETATDLGYKDNSEQTCESNMDIQNECEPMQHPQLR